MIIHEPFCFVKFRVSENFSKIYLKGYA